VGFGGQFTHFVGEMMKAAPAAPPCLIHAWERRQEAHEGVDCVVRVCRRCGGKELCWSRRPLSATAFERFVET